MNGFAYEEQGTNRFLVYEVNKSEELDTFVLGMLQNNDIPGIIKAFSLQIDETVYVRYDITGRQVLTEYFDRTVQRKKVLKILHSILDGMKSSDEYMIKPQMMIMDPKYIYVDIKTGSAELICVPIANEANMVSLPYFLKQFISDLRFDPSEDVGYVARLLTYLNDGISFSFEGFEKLLKELETQETLKKHDTENTPSAIPEEIKKQVRDTREETKKPIVSSEKERPSKEKKDNKDEVKSVSVKKGKKTDESINMESSEKMSLMHLLMHYSKANLEIYKAQKKEERIQDAGFSVPGQEPKETRKEVVEKQNCTNQDKETKEKLDFGDTVMEEAGGAYEDGATVILNEGADSDDTRRLPEALIVRLRTKETIVVDKEEFQIGREPSKVDYCVSDNNAIGREHATILIRGEKAYLVDNHSTNHTYLNGNRIQSGKEFEIQDGDKLKFADEEYEFHM